MKRGPDFFLGRTIQNGTIQLAETLGAGGFGIAYKSHELTKKPLPEPVVVKLFNSDADPLSVAAFLQEAFHLARLQHPNIVSVYDIGVEPIKLADARGVEVTEHYPYFVMQFAGEGDVRRLKPKGSVEPVPVATVLPIASSIAEALQHAHDAKQKPLIHRDVKPENMLRRRNPDTNHIDILLSDFGITAVAHTSNSLSVQDSIGTPPYMAPEQFLGKAVRQTDQYALAVFVYEFLTGRLPFPGKGIRRDMLPVAQFHAWYQLHQNELPPTFEEALKSTGKGGLLGDRKTATTLRALQDVVFTALAKEPEKRYDKVTTFTETLRQTAEEAAIEKPANRPFPGANLPHQEQPTPEVSLRDAVRGAYDLIEAKKFEEAINICDQVIKTNPNNWIAFYYKARAFQNVLRYEEALEAYDQAISVVPQNTPLHIRDLYRDKAILLNHMNRWEEAVTTYDMAIKEDPSDQYSYTLYCNKGDIFFYHALWEEAVEAYDLALKMRPDTYDDVFNPLSKKASSLAHLGRMDEYREVEKKRRELQKRQES